jgi:hypothetical protein
MLAWIEVLRPNVYIAALLATTDDANEHFRALPDAIRSISAVHARDDLRLPCFLLQDQRGIRVLTATEVQAALATAVAAQELDDEDRLVSVFVVREPYVPSVPGRDEMGRLTHCHVGRREATRVSEDGIDVLFLT